MINCFLPRTFELFRCEKYKYNIVVTWSTINKTEKIRQMKNFSIHYTGEDEPAPFYFANFLSVTIKMTHFEVFSYYDVIYGHKVAWVGGGTPTLHPTRISKKFDNKTAKIKVDFLTHPLKKFTLRPWICMTFIYLPFNNG